METMLSLFFVCCFFGGMYALYARARRKREEDIEGIRDYRMKTLKEQGVTPCVKYAYSDWSRNVTAEYLVDDKHNIVFLSNSSEYGYTKVPFKKIIGCELFIDSESCGGVGRAVAGGFIAGEAGAVVGAITAKKKITSVKLTIYIMNIGAPEFTFHLINNQVSKDSYDYIEAEKFAHQVQASIKAIIAMKEMPAVCNPQEEESSTSIQISSSSIHKSLGANGSNPPVRVEVDENDSIECPKCKTNQRGNRLVCWWCGQPFDVQPYSPGDSDEKKGGF